MSRLQYANDTLILIRVEEPQVWRLKLVLDTFAAATSLFINYSKSTFVPINVELEQAGALATILGSPVESFPQTYLGLWLSNSKQLARVLDEFVFPIECCIAS